MAPAFAIFLPPPPSLNDFFSRLQHGLPCRQSGQCWVSASLLTPERFGKPSRKLSVSGDTRGGREVEAFRQWLSVLFNFHKLSWMCVLLQILSLFLYSCLIMIIYHHTLCIFTNAYIYLHFFLVVGFLVALLKISELRVVSKLSGHVLSDGFMFQQVCFRYSLNKYHNSIEVKLLRLPARVPFLHAGCCF